VSEERPAEDAVERLAAWGLVAVGVVLIAMPGLCSLALLNGDDFAEWLATTAVGGCIPILVGIAVLLWGRRILRRGPSPRPAERSEIQVFLGVVLILLALGAVGSCAGPLGVLGPRMTSDTAFYGYGIFALLIFVAALVIVLGLWLMLTSRTPPKD
jgi:cytochrome c biogenesis protein CcdA